MILSFNVFSKINKSLNDKIGLFKLCKCLYKVNINFMKISKYLLNKFNVPYILNINIIQNISLPSSNVLLH